MQRVYACILVAGLTALGGFALTVSALDISDVRISDIRSDSATVQWKTDIESDATINYGLDSSVGIVRDPAFDAKSHLLTIENLDPVTTYYFRVVSTDKDGNKSATAGLVFTTKDDQQAQAQKAIKEVKKVTDPEALKKVIDEVQQQAQDIIRPPSIIGSPKVDAGSTEATISWTSDRSSNSMVEFSPDSDYAGGSYVAAQGSTGESTTRHSVTLTGLEPSTLYHFQVSSSDSVGLKGLSEDDTFRTKSILPAVQNLKVSRIQETSVVISWQTGEVKAKGRVEYVNTRTKVARSTGDPVYTTSHTIQVTGLEFGTRYQATVYSSNEAGDEVASKPFTFITVRDVVPPEITKVTNESTLYPSEDTKVQTIITWQTDEPANCQVFYNQGLVVAEGTSASMPAETNPLTDHTQVIVGFSPATVYKFWVVCNDEVLNESRSDDYVLITPIKEKNIIDIILENFQGTFGWVNKIGK